MGSWTTTSTYYEPITKSKFKVRSVAYIGTDSEGGYKRECGCDGMRNEVCVMSDEGVKEFSCEGISSASVEGADAKAYFWFEIDFSAPLIGVDTLQGTQGWVGPFSVILPDNEGDLGGEDGKVCDSGKSMRYVKSTTTELLQPPLDYNLTDDISDFTNFLGSSAVQNMATLQSSSPGWETSPWNKGTCEEGDVKPVLPIFEWYDCGTADSGDVTRVRFFYHLLVYPDVNSKLSHTLNRWANDDDKPIISGPYCFGGELRAYSFDLVFDSGEENDWVNFNAGCVEGMPCRPGWTEMGAEKEPDIHHDQKGEINLKLSVYLGVACIGLLSACIGLACYVRMLRSMIDEGVREEEGATGIMGFLEYEGLRNGESEDEEEEGDLRGSITF